ncbi:uncharacterized protein LOC128346393 isoform X5 [Hemicordylus capensis]|uniref:uncharacterized protein LOC128346393 isoform X5 n=1 Tax=Hemicordylus capensis TaxID=884348 RepID=UPI002302A735|nr:uncharacterized protein LOC128346393 isoform X5 [Hemicordylus capensis]
MAVHNNNNKKGHHNEWSESALDNTRGTKMLELLPYAGAKREGELASDATPAADQESFGPEGLCQTVISGVLHKEQIQGLLSDLYPLENSSAITELSFCFLKEVDKSNQGFISEDMFMAWVQHLPRDIVESILKFPIIPPSLSDSKVPVSYMNIAEDDQDKQGLDDRQVFRVATELSRRKRNWKLLASKLGILEKNCSHLEHQNLEMKNQHSRWHAQSFQAISHPGTDHLELLSFSKILNMLQMWHRACQEAPLPTLQAALRESGNADICHEVFHLSF